MKKLLLGTMSLVVVSSLLSFNLALAKNEDRPEKEKEVKNLWAPGQFKKLGITPAGDGVHGELKSLASTTVPTTLTVTIKEQDWSVSVNGDTKLYRRYGAAAQLSEFMIGDQLAIKGTITSSSTPLAMTAQVIKNLSIEKKNGTFNGKILSLSATSTSFIIEPKARQQQTINVTSNTKYLWGKKTASRSDLAIGQQVIVKGVWDRQSNNVLADSVTIKIINVVKRGEITAINISNSSSTPSTLTLKTKDQTYTVKITEQTKLVRKFGGKSLLSEFSVGDQAQVTGTLDSETIITAKLVKDISIQKRWGSFTGYIKSLNSTEQTFVLQPTKRDEQTVKVLADTKITNNLYLNKRQQIIVFADLAVNDNVQVDGIWNSQTKTITASKIVIKNVMQNYLNSGITGKILIGPQCPVVTSETTEQCKDKPYQATVVVKNENGGQEVSRFTSNNEGEFKIKLLPGTYLLEPVNASGNYPRANSQTVTVAGGKFTEIIITYDTGIR